VIDEHSLRTEQEHLVAHGYDTVDRDLERLGMTISRLPSEAGVIWRLRLPRWEQFEAWEPGNAGLAPPGEIMELISGVAGGKAMVPSAPVSGDAGGIYYIYLESSPFTVNGKSVVFADLVQEAHNARVQLWSDGYYITPKIHWNQLTLHGRPSLYYAYGAAVSEVIVDTLTGEWKLVRADLLHDAGNSINPAIDTGQVEGAFIQGMGWLTMEELWWNKEGKLMTSAPSTYKIPAVNDCPADFRVRLFKNANHEDTILRSKAVGEPPLLLPFSVFFAIRDAVASVADDRVNPPLNAPATAEEILNAVEHVKTQPTVHPSLQQKVTAIQW